MLVLLSLLAWQPMGAAPSVESTADGGLLLSGSSIAFMSDGATTTLESLLKPSSSPGIEEMLTRMEKLEQRVTDLEAENAALKAQDTAFTTQVGELKQANVEQDLASDAQVSLNVVWVLVWVFSILSCFSFFRFRERGAH